VDDTGQRDELMTGHEMQNVNHCDVGFHSINRFIADAVLPSPPFRASLYSYAWFIGFAVAFGFYLAGRKLVLR